MHIYITRLRILQDVVSQRLLNNCPTLVLIEQYYMLIQTEPKLPFEFSALVAMSREIGWILGQDKSTRIRRAPMSDDT